MLKYCLIFIGCFSIVQAQNEKVLSIEYEVIFKTSTSINQTVFSNRLLVDDSAYIYEFLSSYSTGSFFMPETNGDKHLISYHMGKRYDNVDYHYTNYPYSNGNDYIIRDTLPQIKWEIKNQQLDFSGYSCTRAEGFYRGRYVIAYFTSEVPINIGPANLNGLPGAVLFAYSKDEDFTYTAKKISTIERPLDFVHYETYEFGDVISTKDYVAMIDAENEKDLAYLKSRFQEQMANNGASKDIVNGAQGTISRGTLELYYEWEFKN